MYEMLMALPKYDAETVDGVLCAIVTVASLALCAWMYRVEIARALSDALSRLRRWIAGRNGRKPRAKVHRRKDVKRRRRSIGDATQGEIRVAVWSPEAPSARRRRGRPAK